MEKKIWSVRDISERPQTIAQALRQCDSDAYPNLSVLLKIIGTVAVTSSESIYAIYLRASMRQERLSRLALIKLCHFF